MNEVIFNQLILVCRIRTLQNNNLSKRPKETIYSKKDKCWSIFIADVFFFCFSDYYTKVLYNFVCERNETPSLTYNRTYTLLTDRKYHEKIIFMGIIAFIPIGLQCDERQDRFWIIKEGLPNDSQQQTNGPVCSKEQKQDGSMHH